MDHIGLRKHNDSHLIDIPWEDYLGDNIFEVAGATDLEYLIMDIE